MGNEAWLILSPRLLARKPGVFVYDKRYTMVYDAPGNTVLSGRKVSTPVKGFSPSLPHP